MMGEHGGASNAYPAYEPQWINLAFFTSQAFLAFTLFDMIQERVSRQRYVLGACLVLLALNVFLIYMVVRIGGAYRVRFVFKEGNICIANAKGRIVETLAMNELEGVEYRAPWYARNQREFVVKFPRKRSIVIRPIAEDRAEFLTEIEGATGRSFGIVL